MAAVRQYWRNLLLCAFVSFCAMFNFGYLQTYPNTALDAFTDWLNHTWQHRFDTYMSDRHAAPLLHALVRTQLGTAGCSTFEWLWSALTNIYMAGLIIGTLFTPLISERLGRKRTSFV